MKPVTISDPVYGEVIFTEPLLIELYHTRTVQRLGKIYQAGVTAFITGDETTRLDHSVGAAALLRRMGAPVEEQAAGLLHDVAHTAFSHVVDFVFPNRAQDYHERHREVFVAASDLPEVLERHGLDWRRVSDADNYSLLEQPLPGLCADRLDYFLRDGVAVFENFSQAEAQDFLAHLRIWEGQIVVGDRDAARWLGDRFIELDDLSWCSVREVGWYAVMARALQAALAHGVIAESDFAGTDVELMARIRAAGIPEVQRWLDLLRPEVDFERSANGADLVVLPKVRAVDPPVLVGGESVPLSCLDPEFAERRQAYVASKEGAWRLKII